MNEHDLCIALLFSKLPGRRSQKCNMYLGVRFCMDKLQNWSTVLDVWSAKLWNGAVLPIWKNILLKNMVCNSEEAAFQQSNNIALSFCTQQVSTICCFITPSEICALLRYYAAQSGNSLLTFRDILLNLYSKNQEIQKTEQYMTAVSWHNLHFWDLSITWYFKEVWSFRSQFCFPFQAKKCLLWWTLTLRYSQAFGATEAVTCQDKHQRTNLVPW
jgi:hypothetical protein